MITGPVVKMRRQAKKGKIPGSRPNLRQSGSRVCTLNLHTMKNYSTRSGYEHTEKFTAFPKSKLSKGLDFFYTDLCFCKTKRRV